MKVLIKNKVFFWLNSKSKVIADSGENFSNSCKVNRGKRNPSRKYQDGCSEGDDRLIRDEAEGLGG